MYRPDEIIVVKQVINHPVTCSILNLCHGAAVRVAKGNHPNDIKKTSHLLSGANGLRETLAVGKQVLAIVSTTDVIKGFDMPDKRIGCPHFTKLVMASNGCPYYCVWCYLRLTYRVLYPCIVVRVKYKEIIRKIKRCVRKSSLIVIFNMGELQDGLALEHLTGAAQVLIPIFGQLQNGYLFILTKSDNVEPILALPHNGHTILCWSINAAEISAAFELGAPSFERRLTAAKRAQEAGCPLRIRLDPIVLVPGWKKMYAEAIKRIFAEVTPERVTIGTLRFEPEFYNNRYNIVVQERSGRRLLAEMEKMQPMLPPMPVPTDKKDEKGRPKTKVSIGKYSYPQPLRVELFRFTIGEIRRYFNGPIALCKEIKGLWPTVGLDPQRCECVCQYGTANLLHCVARSTKWVTAQETRRD